MLFFLPLTPPSTPSGFMPKAMFAGIFLVVGWGSVEGNPIVHKTLFLLRDPNLTPRDHPLHGVRKSSIAKFIGIQWLFFAMIIAVSETLGELLLGRVFVACADTALLSQPESDSPSSSPFSFLFDTSTFHACLHRKSSSSWMRRPPIPKPCSSRSEDRCRPNTAVRGAV